MLDINFMEMEEFLAQAYNSDTINSIQRIHIIDDKNWSYSIQFSHHTSFVLTIIHEIGHAIGI